MEQNKNIKSRRDGELKSVWQSENLERESCSSKQNHKIYDAIIIGGGITGITTALLLQLEGKNCIVLEGNTLGFGTTGGTSAHLNTFFDTTYPEIEKDFSENTAKLVAQSGKEAFQLIQNLIGRFKIDCDYEKKNASLFSETEKESKQLNEILASSKKAGIFAKKAQHNHLPIAFQEVIVFPEQAQFHPLKYLFGLAQAFFNAGGVILENKFIDETGFENDLHYAESNKERFQGKSIIHATHIPQGINAFSFKCAPYRSYVIAVSLLDGNYPQELIYDMQEPYHYFRTHEINGEKLLLIGGEDHKTGHSNPEAAFNKLINYSKQYFNIDKIAYQWSSQYYIPVDGLPYIGHFSGKDKGAYVATGYNGNGMIFGTLSAKIITDMILGKTSPYEEIYNPTRIKPLAEFSELLKENADVAWHFIADRFNSDFVSSLKEIQNDSGNVVMYENKRIAVYKDKSGKLHLLNPTCTHAGCIVNWNQTEKSWDCPCHGGRFDINGEVITGPPTRYLEKINL